MLKTSINLIDSISEKSFRTLFFQLFIFSSIIFHGQFESIGLNYFQKCSKLQLIELIQSVKYLHGSCISNCLSFSSIIYHGQFESLATYWFSRGSKLQSMKSFNLWNTFLMLFTMLFSFIHSFSWINWINCLNFFITLKIDQKNIVERKWWTQTTTWGAKFKDWKLNENFSKHLKVSENKNLRNKNNVSESMKTVRNNNKTSINGKFKKCNKRAEKFNQHVEQ
jgi:hypothetical protein